jgi:hypothetical protein
MGNRIKRINAGLIALSVLLIVSGTFISCFRFEPARVFFWGHAGRAFIIAGKGLNSCLPGISHSGIFDLFLCALCFYHPFHFV